MLLDIFGNLHPVLLHLPIGVLIYGYLHFTYDVIFKKKKEPVDLSFVLGVGAVAAILSTISGLLLSRSADYSGELLEWHKWLGIGTACISIFIFYFYKYSKGKGRFYLSFSILIVLLVVTGHYGGSITHGEGFLLPEDQANYSSTTLKDPLEAHVFNDLVMPIAKEKCNSCHNARKKKGKLLLTTLEGWKNGGKSGGFIVTNDRLNSLMFKRLHLPKEEKKHMPPSGKKQLDSDELEFLDWWINSVKTYEERVEELDPPAPVLAYIQRKLTRQFIDVPKIEASDILKLQNEGIPVSRISNSEPWLSVDFEGGSKVQISHLKKLLKFKENIRQIDLSNTGIGDNDLRTVNKFENLRSINLSLNAISSQGIRNLKDLKSLERLNLYGTSVDKSVLEFISNFPALKSIYLWQTKVEAKDLSSINLNEAIEVNVGPDLELFSDAQVMPPTFENEKMIFQDSISVGLQHFSKNARIYYTTNGQNPTEASNLYRNPFVLHNTHEVKVLATMDGWKNSVVTSKSFLKTSHLPVACTTNPAPNEKYSGAGDSTLINLEKGSEQFSDGRWLGFYGEDVSITLDLGETKKVKAIAFGSLSDYKSYIFNPIGIKIYGSKEKDDLLELTSKKYPPLAKPEDAKIRDYIVDVPNAEVRFLRLHFTALKQNPEWHSAPGADCWLFLDEIIID